MTVPAKGWKNKKGTENRSCNCGSWKQHWINYTGETWPSICSILDCNKHATLGAHIINDEISGEYIVPACDSCNKLESKFNLKSDIELVSANKQKTCG